MKLYELRPDELDRINQDELQKVIEQLEEQSNRFPYDRGIIEELEYFKTIQKGAMVKL